MFKKEKNKIISIYSIVPELLEVEECIPKKTNKFIPEWFKNISPSPLNFGTVRDCPSFTDWFSSGFIIPMWMDSVICYDETTDKWQTKSSDIMANWEFHAHNQLVNHITPNFQGLNGTGIFKAVCPWRIVTPPGYSVLQLPLFYNFNKNWSVLPGIIDTDIHHEINQQILYHGNNKEVFIKRGEPFAMYIPFKREKHKILLKELDQKTLKKFKINEFKIHTKLIGEGAYRKMQKERDKNI